MKLHVLSPQTSRLSRTVRIRDLSQGHANIYTRICSREARPAPVRRPGGRWLPLANAARAFICGRPRRQAERTEAMRAYITTIHANITREPSPTRRLTTSYVIPPRAPVPPRRRMLATDIDTRGTCMLRASHAAGRRGRGLIQPSHHSQTPNAVRVRSRAHSAARRTDLMRIRPSRCRRVAHHSARDASARAHTHTHTPVGREPTRHK